MCDRTGTSLGLLLLLLSVVLGGCSSSYTRDGQPIPEDYAEAILAESESVDVEKLRIESAVSSLEFERGAPLLERLTWLISQKEMAVPIISDQLLTSDARVKANLLYVLGFTRTKESTAALVTHMQDADKIVRYEAAAGLLNQGDTTAVPVLIDFLNHPDRRFRFKAIQVLKMRIGREFDYRFSATQEARQQSIERWQGWWAKEKKRLMYRPKVGQ